MTLQIVVITELAFQLCILPEFLRNSQVSALWIQPINKQDGVQLSYLFQITNKQDGLQPNYQVLSFCRQICVSLAALLERVTLIPQMSLLGQTCSTLRQLSIILC